jgi:hypothetical protein
VKIRRESAQDAGFAFEDTVDFADAFAGHFQFSRRKYEANSPGEGHPQHTHAMNAAG